MATTSQLLKGLMDGVILKIIDSNDTYGYEIYEKLQHSGFDDFAEGSLYPLLLRLEKKNFIKGVKRPSDYGPDRKYYSLTKDGKEEMNTFKDAFDKISFGVNRIWI